MQKEQEIKIEEEELQRVWVMIDIQIEQEGKEMKEKKERKNKRTKKIIPTDQEGVERNRKRKIKI